MDDLAKMLGSMDYNNPAPQQGRSGQLPTEADSLPNQQLHETSDAYQQMMQAVPPASGPQQWPQSNNAAGGTDWYNPQASMAIMIKEMLKGKIPINDQLNMSPGTDLRYSPQ